MFKTLHNATNVGEQARDIIIKLAAVLYFAPPHQSQIGKTVIELVGRHQGGGGAGARVLSVTNSPQEVVGMFETGTVFPLHAWDSRSGTEWDGRQVFVVLTQVRVVEPFEKTIVIHFSDGTDIRVIRDQEAEAFLKALEQLSEESDA